MKKYSITILLGILAFAGVAYADFAPSEWKFMKPINITPSGSTSEYVRVDLDNEVSFAAQADLADIRVIANTSKEIPYQLVTENPQHTVTYADASVRDIATRNGETMFIVDLGATGTIHNHLDIQTPSKNFKRQVAVYASNSELTHDDPKWLLVNGSGVRGATPQALDVDAHIYNFHDDTLSFDAGKTDIRYMDNTSRYLRVVVRKGEGSVPIQIGAVRVYRNVIQSGGQHLFRLESIRMENLKMQSTELVVDLGGRGIPTHRINIDGRGDKNFNRRVVIQTSNDASSWQPIAQGYIFNLTTKIFTGSGYGIDYPETNARYIRAIIFNEDDQPIDVYPTVSVFGTVRSVVFAPDMGSNYALYYGNEKARAPHYDLARFFQYIESTVLMKGSLNVQVPNIAYTPPLPPTVPYSEKKPYFLNIVLVILVVALTLLIIWYLKKLKLSERGEKS